MVTDFTATIQIVAGAAANRGALITNEVGDLSPVPANATVLVDVQTPRPSTGSVNTWDVFRTSATAGGSPRDIMNADGTPLLWEQLQDPVTGFIFQNNAASSAFTLVEIIGQVTPSVNDHLITFLNPEGATSTADLIANTTGIIGPNTTLETITPPGLPTENYIRNLEGQSGLATPIINPVFSAPAAGTQNEIEAHVTMYIPDASDFAGPQTPINNIIELDGFNNDVIFELEAILDNRLVLRWGQGGNQALNILDGLFAGSINHIVLRARGQSATNQSDGDIEVWVNDVRVGVVNDNQFRTFSGGLLQGANVRQSVGGPGEEVFMNNIFTLNEWTTPDNVAPPYFRVQSLSPTTVELVEDVRPELGVIVEPEFTGFGFLSSPVIG